MTTIIRTRHLSKRFGDLRAVDRVNLQVDRGHIFGLFGTNGSGKTTLMNMLLQLVRPTEGSLELFGEPVRPDSVLHRGKIGSLIGRPALYDHLTGEENLQLHAAYLGVPDRRAVDDTLHLVGLARSAGKPVGTYSVGMRQRLGIARAVLHRPELLILDEPLSGLDPEGAEHMVDFLVSLQRERQTTILIASHQLEELAGCLHAAGYMREGRLAAQWQPREWQILRKKHRSLRDILAAASAANTHLSTGGNDHVAADAPRMDQI